MNEDFIGMVDRDRKYPLAKCGVETRRCECIDGFINVPDTNFCVEKAVAFGQACVVSEQCEGIGGGSICHVS